MERHVLGVGDETVYRGELLRIAVAVGSPSVRQREVEATVPKP